ncbi:MAG: hypothetical protein DDG60_00470 [Anaerolineae bacterium]|nr:MAG: hypothetical protein DDG60_00470 [Anaerolineae bacterium]
MANTFIFDDEEEPQSNLSSSQEFSPDEGEEVEEEGEGEGTNRTFLILLIVLGVALFSTLVCGAIVVFMFVLPGQNNARATQTEEARLAFEITQAAQQTAIVQSFTPTPSPTDTPTLAPTTTPVILFPTETPTALVIDPATATVQALETRRAELNLTSTAQATAGARTTGTGTPGTPVVGAGTPAPTALSQTGFADEVGLPGLFIAALTLFAVILLVRYLRQTTIAR